MYVPKVWTHERVYLYAHSDVAVTESDCIRYFFWIYSPTYFLFKCVMYQFLKLYFSWNISKYYKWQKTLVSVEFGRLPTTWFTKMLLFRFRFFQRFTILGRYWIFPGTLFIWFRPFRLYRFCITTRCFFLELSCHNWG